MFVSLSDVERSGQSPSSSGYANNGELEARNPQWSDPEWNAAAADTLEHVSRTIPRVFHEIEVVADEGGSRARR